MPQPFFIADDSSSIILQLFLLLVILVLLSALFALVYHIRRRNAAVLELRMFLEQLINGQPGQSIDFIPPSKLMPLADALNRLAAHLTRERALAARSLLLLNGLQREIDAVDHPLIAADQTERIILFNGAAERLFERDAAWAFDRKIRELFPHQEMLELLKEAMESSAVLVRHIRLGVANRSVTFEVSLLRLRDETGSQGLLIMLRDLTDLLQTVQMKTDFVANASHELRTPLASIRAAVETINEAGLNDHETARRCVDIIGGHALRLQMLVQDLLDLSHTEDPRSVIRMERIDLEQVFQFIAATFASVVTEKKLDMRIDIAPDARVIRGDQRLLNLILRNLVDNSLKFTAAGSVVIRSRRDAGRIVVEVQDTGCGIPPEDQTRVFERFYTVNRSRGGADRGTGLGLAIVKHAVAAMAGTVQLQSTLAQGTTIRCIWPLPTPDSPATPSNLPTPDSPVLENFNGPASNDLPPDATL